MSRKTALILALGGIGAETLREQARCPRFVLVARESPDDPPWTWVMFLRRGQEASKMTARRVEQAHCLDAARDLISEASYICVQAPLVDEAAPLEYWTWVSPLAEASWRAAQLREQGLEP